jgi:hypothetical protein
MSVKKGKDSKGPYYQRGSQKNIIIPLETKNQGKKPKLKQEKQGSTIRASGYQK